MEVVIEKVENTIVKVEVKSVPQELKEIYDDAVILKNELEGLAYSGGEIVPTESVSN